MFTENRYPEDKKHRRSKFVSASRLNQRARRMRYLESHRTSQASQFENFLKSENRMEDLVNPQSTGPEGVNQGNGTSGRITASANTFRAIHTPTLTF